VKRVLEPWQRVQLVRIGEPLDRIRGVAGMYAAHRDVLRALNSMAQLDALRIVCLIPHCPNDPAVAEDVGAQAVAHPHGPVFWNDP